MGHKVLFDVNTNYLCLKLTGDQTYDDMVKARDAVKESLLVNNLKRVLVDTTGLISSMGQVDDYKFASGLQETFNFTTKIAFLILPDFFEKYKFIENVAYNRGINLKVFTDKSEAIKWISSK